MWLRTDRRPVRLLGALFGVACCGFGIFLLLADPQGVTLGAQDRAFGFGITLILVGAIALLASLTAHDVDTLWYRKPRRWRMLRGKAAPWKYGDF